MKSSIPILLTICLFSTAPVFADTDNSSQTTSTSSTNTTIMSADLKYEILAKIRMHYLSGELIYDELHVGDIIKEPKVQSIPGYRFLGWFNSKTGEKWDFSKPITESVDLVAKYEKIKSDSDMNTGTGSNIYLYGAIMIISLMGLSRKRKAYL